MLKFIIAIIVYIGLIVCSLCQTGKKEKRIMLCVAAIAILNMILTVQHVFTKSVFLTVFVFIIHLFVMLFALFLTLGMENENTGNKEKKEHAGNTVSKQNKKEEVQVDICFENNEKNVENIDKKCDLPFGNAHIKGNEKEWTIVIHDENNQSYSFRSINGIIKQYKLPGQNIEKEY